MVTSVTARSAWGMVMQSKIVIGNCLDVLKTLDDCSIQTCITSPPYWGLRDYGVGGQLGLEKTPNEYVAKMVEVFREVRRVLRNDGTLWLNLGDSYAGSGKGAWDNKNGGQKEVYIPDPNGPQSKIAKVPDGLKSKDLVGIPWRVAFALQADGWYLRQDIIWHKPNPMPESVRDRCTKSHEYIFLLSKSERYYFDCESVKEKAAKGSAGSLFNKGKTAGHQMGRSSDIQRIDATTRNRRSVWTVATQPFKGAHFATFPPKLIEPCILAGSKEGDTVLDPFNGAGTTGLVAFRENRNYIGIELNPEYAEIAEKRIENERTLFNA